MLPTFGASLKACRDGRPFISTGDKGQWVKVAKRR